jgi:hypothetical protein
VTEDHHRYFFGGLPEMPWNRRKKLMDNIFEEIRAKRGLQDQKHGGPDHDDQHSMHDWAVFIIKFLGKAISGFSLEWARSYLIDVAALTVAAIESIDRSLTGG